MNRALVVLFQLLLSCARVAAAAKDISFLMVGNSFTNANHLQEMIKSMLEEDLMFGSQVYAMRFRKPASRFAEDVLDPALASTIAERSWDWVILQEQSQIPAFIGTYYDPTFQLSLNATVQMNSWIQKANAETVLLMTWGRRTDDFMYPELFPDFETMQTMLVNGYSIMQKTISTPNRPVRMAPAGLAFQSVKDSIPKGVNASADGTAFSNLYASDGVHPSVEGSYLIACVVYATLTGNDPRKLTQYLGPKEIPADTRAKLREHAFQTVEAFDISNEYNRQYFSHFMVKGQDISPKPYAPAEKRKGGSGETSSSSRHFGLVLIFGAMLAFGAFYVKKKGDSPWQRVRRQYQNVVESPQDLELVDMPEQNM